MTEETLGSLSSEEQAYFSSRGETEIKAEPPPVQEQAEPSPVVLDEEDDDVSGDAGAPKEQKTVPLAALTKTRQEFKAKLADLERANAIWEDRWNTLLKVNEQQQAPAQQVEDDPMPDPNTDIFAHAAWQKRQLDKLQSRIDQRETTEKQASEAQQREKAVWSFWDQSVNSYKAETPDFTDAAKFLSDARTQQLKAYAAVDSRFGNDQMVNQQIDHELREIIVLAAQQKRNPAQAVYELAKSWGYKGKAPQAGEDVLQTMERTQQAIEQSASLSSVGGARPGGEIDAQAVANMSPAQFEAWLNKNGVDKFRKLAGG